MKELKETVQMPLDYVNHDLLEVVCHMGEVREILRGFELGEITGKEKSEKFAKRGIEYIDVTVKRLEEIRGELKSQPKKIVDYKVATCEVDFDQFIQHVQRLIGEGYQPFGGIAVSNVSSFPSYAQSLVKYG